VHIARATRDDIDDLAHLIRLDTPGAMTSAGTFSADLAEWWDEHQGTHHAFVAWADDSTVVGMAWLAMLPRVPRPGATNRLCADIQTVFVLPRTVARASVRLSSKQRRSTGPAWVPVGSPCTPAAALCACTSDSASAHRRNCSNGDLAEPIFPIDTAGSRRSSCRSLPRGMERGAPG